MGNLLFNSEKGLRNGWWVLLFLVVLTAQLTGLRALIPIFKRFGIHSGDWVIGVLFLFSLAATWLCTLLRGETLASVGWRLNRRWFQQLAVGFLVGMGLLLMAAGLLWAVGGVSLELNPARSLGALGVGFLVFVMVALWEENLFRGFAFQRLVAGLGVWPAQLLLALFFGLSHWGNPGMHGATKVWATLDIALVAVLLGLTYLRTRSLALPVGIHLGWNWLQGNGLGFGVSGTASLPGWFRPVFHSRPEWVSGGAFGLEASIFGVLVALIGILLVWRWKGVPEADAQNLLLLED